MDVVAFSHARRRWWTTIGIAAVAAAAVMVVGVTPTPASANGHPGGHVGKYSWRAPNAHGAIEGYADRVSVLPGQRVHLFVSTAAQRYRVWAFRMGWYSGHLGELVWSSAVLRGHVQSGPSLLRRGTHTWTARWRRSLTIRTRGWQPGDYLLRLDTAGGKKSYVPLTVRARSAKGAVVLVNAVTTWQAYNTWGCCDLYEGANGSFDSRSRAVVFDRPYDTGNGAGQFIRNELQIVAQAERLGLKLDYVTDVDLQAHPHILKGAAEVVSMGHDEYWSPTMRAAVTRARNHGTNLAFFGANAIFRRIRFGRTKHGPDRLEINYKIASEDPLYGKDNRRVTADWPSPPDARPESSLLGDQYACNLGKVKVAGVVSQPNRWMFAGTHVHRGTRLPGLIGSETDAVQSGYPTPHPIAVVMHSPEPCGGGPAYADTSYYVAHSGAGVFDAGSIGWSCVFGQCRSSGRTAKVIRTVTQNVLRVFSHKRAGRHHPVNPGR